jgi:glucose-6-phosphate 1-dehydrogenase
VWHWLARRIHYVSGTFDDSEAYQQLKTLLTPQTGYERLLYDCMMVDATLFQRSDVEETGWQIVAPLLDVRGALPARNSPNYESASWAPQEADELLRRDGRSWGQSE